MRELIQETPPSAIRFETSEVPKARPGNLDARTEAWRFYYDNSLDIGLDALDRAIRSMAVRMIPPGMRVLDVGTGRGHLLAALRPEVGVGIDLSKRAVMEARERYGHLHFRVADVRDREAIGPLDGPFDFILLNQTLTETADLVETLLALHAHAAPWTRLVVLERLRSRLPRWAPAPVRIRSADLDPIFGLGGFEVLSHWKSSVLQERFRLPGLRFYKRFHAHVLRPAPHLMEASPTLTASIVLPILVERDDLSGFLKRLPDPGDDTEYLLVTTTDTHPSVKAAVRKLDASRFRILNSRSHKRADALHEGITSATGDCVVLLGDPPGETPEAIPRFLEAIRTWKGDLVLANRRIYPDPRRGRASPDRLVDRILSRLHTRRAGQRVGDVNPYLKAIRRRDLDRIRKLRNDQPFEEDGLIAAAGRLHLKILDIPVPLEAGSSDPAKQGNVRRLLQRLRLLARSVISR